MKILYRELFLKDLKELKKQPIYKQIVELAFTTLPKVKTLREVWGIKAMKRYPKRYRIRVGNYRIGIEVKDDTIEIMRVLHRGEFYRYFP
ncbi:MAG: type II toxin-antitoxin system RelE/ParE family toxin [bacterium]